MSEAFRECLELFNRRRYFACQEILEGLWRDAPEEDKRFFEVLIQLAAALHLRLERTAGRRGALNLLNQALVRMEDYRPRRLGVDVDALCRDTQTYVEGLKKGRGRSMFERFRAPKIRLA